MIVPVGLKIIGTLLGVDATTIYNALKREGMAVRSPNQGRRRRQSAE